MFRIVDRYLVRRIAAGVALTTLTVTLLLALENTHRLLTEVEKTEAPFSLLGRMLLALVPEYLSAAAPVAIFIGMAMAVRNLSLRGEWQMFSAMGMPLRRIMLAPMLVALLVAAVQLELRFELRPWGEHSLDAIYLEVYGGRHGIPIPTGQQVDLDERTNIFVDSAGAKSGDLNGIVIHRGDDTLSAATANLTRDDNGNASLILSKGSLISQMPSGELRSMRFDSYIVDIHAPKALVVPPSAREELERTSSRGLFTMAAHQWRIGGQQTALAALTRRVTSAILCLLLPFLALVLGTPPRREAGGAAIFLGICFIVAFDKSAAMVEDNFASHPLLGGMLNLGFWGGLVAWTVVASRRQPEGFIDLWLRSYFGRIWATIRRRMASPA